MENHDHGSVHGNRNDLALRKQDRKNHFPCSPIACHVVSSLPVSKSVSGVTLDVSTCSPRDLKDCEDPRRSRCGVSCVHRCGVSCVHLMWCVLCPPGVVCSVSTWYGVSCVLTSFSTNELLSTDSHSQTGPTSYCGHQFLGVHQTRAPQEPPSFFLRCTFCLCRSEWDPEIRCCCV